MARKKRDKHEKRMKTSNRRSRDSSIDNNDGRSSGIHDTDSIAESSFSIYSAFGTAAAGSMISSEDGDDQTLTINNNNNGSKTTSKNNNNNNNLSATTCATIVDYDDFAHRLDSLLGQMRETKISPKMRCENFNALSRTMITRMCDEYLDRRELTLQDILERAFRRASPAEMESAASTLTISLITLASGGGGGKLFASLYAILQRTLLDPTAHPRARAKCAITLAIGCFIIDDDDDDDDGYDHGDEQKRHNLSAKLLKIAFESRQNCDDNDDDDDGGGDNEHEQFALRECCLTMFALLASIENRAFARKCLSARGAGLRFYDCLESSNFSVRIAAGKCVAMLLEIEFDDDGDGDEDEDEDSVEEEEEEDNEDYEDDADDDYDDDEFRNHNHHNLREMLLERLQCLATDSQRWRSKKDLRQQRSIFRAILRATRGEDYESQTVMIGPSGCNDSIIIDCWRTSVRYDAFRSVLGSGISLHLARNRCLREIFDLGPPVSAAAAAASIALEIDPNRKSSIVTDRRAAKLEKASLNHFNRKNRELNRAKVRSKRSDYHPNGSGGRRSSSSSD